MFRCQHVTNDDNAAWVPPEYCEQPATMLVQYKEHAGYFFNNGKALEAFDWFTVALCDEHRDDVPTSAEEYDGTVEYEELRLRAGRPFQVYAQEDN